MHQHKWTWPNKLKKPPEGYDSYQVCTVCGEERLYSFERMEAGPELYIAGAYHSA